MLPKVANHIIHHTSRAVLAVQNQTGQTIRNVLQLQTSTAPSNAAGNLSPWNTPGSSSSGWGSSSGPGPGGAKYHSNSRFYSSYANTGIGRASTLVDPSVAHAQNPDSFDDPDELSLGPPLRVRQRRRSRSSSLSFTGRDRDDHLPQSGILRTIQLHLRARHAFSTAPPHSVLADGNAKTDEPLVLQPPLSREVYSNATSESDDELLQHITKAKESKDLSLALAQLQKMRDRSPPPSSAVYNAVISCLESIRKPGESLQHILQAYHDMLNRSVVPTTGTYTRLILVLTRRDAEIHEAIHKAESRLRPETATGEPHDSSIHTERIAQLQSENNFGSALTLFHAAAMLPRSRIPLSVYADLIQACTLHSNIDAAIHVYAHLEQRRDIHPSPSIFRDLIKVYASTGDLAGAQEVFGEFRSACKSGRVTTQVISPDNNVGDVDAWKVEVTNVWNQMIEASIRLSQPAAGLALLEEMMDTPSGPDFSLSDPPLPSLDTFASVISAFVESGDVESALAWFNRLLAQSDKPAAPHLPLTNPTRPHAEIWSTILSALIQRNMFEELATVLETAQSIQADLPSHVFIDALDIFAARCLSLPELPDNGLVSILDSMCKFALSAIEQQIYEAPSDMYSRSAYSRAAPLYIRFGQPIGAVKVFQDLLELVNRAILHGEKTKMLDIRSMHNQRRFLSNVFEELYPAIFEAATESNWTIKDAMRMFRLSRHVNIIHPSEVLRRYLEPFAYATSLEQKAELTVEDWESAIVIAALLCKKASSGPVTPFSLLIDVVQRGMLEAISTRCLRLAGGTMNDTQLAELLAPYPEDARRYFVGRFRMPNPMDGPSYDAVTTVPDIHRVPNSVRVDHTHSKFIEDCLIPPDLKPLDAYHRFEAGLEKGVYPSPGTLAKLIAGLGRIGEVDKLRKAYDAAQVVLASIEKSWAKSGWFFVEDAMIIALAHAGDADAAHVHRTRILAHGGTPSADAYGALIQVVKDTTDDATNAMALFNEAISRDVPLNIFLFNTAISKLAKARKADHALALFQHMKTSGLHPTSVTYGAVIAACCRVGDAQSAEALFHEMASQRNFRPRVPPYNTMMQLYTHTKPDRERVLHYYNELLRAQVRPTAHTYKLLLDAYGTIEPVDLDSMQKVFDDLVADRHVQVQGTHWAALINAWGCVRKDLDKAISIFDSIPAHPSTRRSGSQLPDAVTFEALFNVLVTHRRTDLFSPYIEKLASHNIHMTAYIANLLIKGYAAVGDIDKAREVFEGLADPPEGVAAPNNHAPHDGESASNAAVPVDAPVYREPSTWEAMVRAELGNGNRDQALALLERVQARRFPIAVYNRISGIMLDDSVSPWAPSPESLSPVSSPSS